MAEEPFFEVKEILNDKGPLPSAMMELITSVHSDATKGATSAGGDSRVANMSKYKPSTPADGASIAMKSTMAARGLAGRGTTGRSTPGTACGKCRATLSAGSKAPGGIIARMTSLTARVWRISPIAMRINSEQVAQTSSWRNCKDIPGKDRYRPSASRQRSDIPVRRRVPRPTHSGDGQARSKDQEAVCR